MFSSPSAFPYLQEAQEVRRVGGPRFPGRGPLGPERHVRRHGRAFLPRLQVLRVSDHDVFTWFMVDRKIWVDLD